MTISPARRRDPRYETGYNVELKIGAWLAAHGWPVARVTHAGAFAPMLSVWSEKVVLPDLQAHLDTGLVWLEVKAKTSVAVFEKAGLRRTGCDLANYLDYERVQGLTGYPVYVVFVQHDQKEIRHAQVGDGGWKQGTGNGESMIYRDYDALPMFAPYAEVMSTAGQPRLRADEPLFGPAAVQQPFEGMR